VKVVVVWMMFDQKVCGIIFKYIQLAVKNYYQTLYGHHTTVSSDKKSKYFLTSYKRLKEHITQHTNAHKLKTFNTVTKGNVQKLFSYVKQKALCV